jgi:uncharacterized RDD family membrane protein YckC
LEKNMAAGYLSEQNKRKFTIAAGIISAVFFFAQFIVPMIIMMFAMPALMFSGNFQLKNAHPERGAYWDDTIWYIESIQSFQHSAQLPTTLNKLIYDDGMGSEVIAEIPFQDSWLLADNDILWIISSSGVAYYTNGDMQTITDSQKIGNISRPFIFNKVPAVIEESPDGFSLMLFENSRWTDKHFFTIKHLEGPQCGIKDIQVIVAKEKLSFFVRLGQTIFYRDGLPASEDTSRSGWQPVIKSGSNWYTMLFEDKPAIFFNNYSQNLSEISGMMLEDDRWQPFFSYEQSFPGDMGIFFTEAPDYFYMLLQGMPGSLKLLEFEGSKMLGKYRHGSGFPFPKSMIGIMVIPQIGMLFLPLILAIILSGLMFKHRITVHKANSNQMQYASLIRRAAAQLVDMAIVLGPSFLIGFHFLFSFWDMEDLLFSDPTNIAGFLGMFAFSFFWIAICYFTYSILEGKYGCTPGKWMTGIRVLGLDFQPCGIGRGLLRNLLKVVDGFFNFMVGIMVVALSENWQRIGDMAARTIVVRTDSREE